MRKMKNVIGVVCAMTMVASSLVGCGNANETTGEKTSEAASKTEESKASEVVESSVEASVEEVIEPIEELPISDGSITLKVAIPVDAKVEDITTNKLTDYIQEETGIKLEFIELETTDTATQVNAIMNGGNLPDIFIGYNFPYETLCSYADAGLILPLDEYIDKWGYNLKNTIMADPDLGETVLGYATYDGQVWAMPSGGGMVTNVYSTYQPRIQYYYLDELGLELPKTLDDFRAFLEAVHEKYPDVIPMTAWADKNFIFANISQAFQFTNKDTYLKNNNGQVEFIGNNEAFLEAIKYTKQMVDDGLIDPAAFTQDMNVLSTRLAQEGYNVAVLACGNGYSSVLDSEGEEYINMGLVGALEGPEGYISAQIDPNATTVRTALVVTSACQYPEEAFRLFDFFLSDDFAIKARVGFEGEQWQKAADGVLGRDGEQAWFSLLTAQEWIQPSTNVIWNNERFIHSNIMNHCEAASGVSAKHVVSEEIVNQGIKEMNTYEYLPQLVMSSDEVGEYNELRTLIVSSVDANVAQFILGTRDISEFDDYCAELESMGVERYVELAQKAYSAMSE